VLQTVGFATFPQVTLAATTAANAIKAVGQASRLAGLGAATTATFGALFAAGGAALYGMYDLDKEMDKAAEAQKNLTESVAQNAERLREIIENSAKHGILNITNFQRQAWDALLSQPSAERNRIVADQLMKMPRAPQFTAAQEWKQFLASQQLQSAQEMSLGRVSVGDSGPTGGIFEFERAARAQLAFIEQQKSAGKISASEAAATALEIRHNYQMQLAGMSADGLETLRELTRSEGGEYQGQLAAIKAHFNARKALVEAYYELMRQKSAESSDDEAAKADKFIELAGERAADLKQLNAEQERAIFLASDLGRVAQFSAQNFSAGFANAFVQFASGTKSAGEAFKGFAASFMQSVAQMIIQMLVLRVVSSFLGLGGGGGGGGALGPGGNFSAFARGGFAPKLAANGIMEVNSPTYFPGFNVLAGEAGREVMAVFAQPRLMSIGGMQAMTGSVQGNRLAMVGADDLARRGGGGVGGTITIQVVGSRDYEARILDQAVEGASVRMQNDLVTDTPMRRAVKDAAS